MASCMCPMSSRPITSIWKINRIVEEIIEEDEFAAQPIPHEPADEVETSDQESWSEQRPMGDETFGERGFSPFAPMEVEDRPSPQEQPSPDERAQEAYESKKTPG